MVLGLVYAGWFGFVLPQGLFCPKSGKDPPMLQWRRAKVKTRSEVCLAGTQQASLTENKPKAA